MTFNDLHPRGAAGRFIATHHAEASVSLGAGPDWAAWRDGLEIPTFRLGKKFTEYTRRGTPVRVTAGVIDRDARQIFTRGQCMALVRVLSDAKAGTPVIAFEPGTTSLAHALIRLPDGTLLDIDGVHDAADVGQDYDLVDYEPEDFAAHVDARTGFAEWSDPPNYEMAKTFVSAVTAKVRGDRSFRLRTHEQGPRVARGRTQDR